jgi:hypothetical protein
MRVNFGSSAHSLNRLTEDRTAMISRIGYSFISGVSFAIYGLIIGYVLNSPIPIAVAGFIIGLLFG